MYVRVCVCVWAVRRVGGGVCVCVRLYCIWTTVSRVRIDYIFAGRVHMRVRVRLGGECMMIDHV